MSPLAWRMVCGVASGALMAAAFPPYNLPWLLPVAIAILVWSLQNATIGEALMAGLSCGVVHYSATLFWLGVVFGASCIPLIVAEAAFIAGFCAIVQISIHRLPRLPWWLVTPVAWTAMEFLRSEPMALFQGWVGLGYALAGLPPFMWMAGSVGASGLSFVVAMFGGLLVPTESRWARTRVLVTANVWLVLCALSLWPMERGSALGEVKPTQPILVRLVQARVEDEGRHVALSRDPSRRVDVIVWPEYSLTQDPMKSRHMWNRLSNVARANSAVLIAGGIRRLSDADDSFWNTAFVLGPDGESIGQHVKNHPIRFLRDGIASDRAVPLPTPVGRLGVAISFDMDFPDIARRLVGKGAEVFLVPNRDPVEWDPVQRAQHVQMFQLRAAETGRWIGRADASGGTLAIDPRGNIVAKVPSGAPTALNVRLGREHSITGYVVWGWLLPRVCLLLVPSILAASIVGPKYRR